MTATNKFEWHRSAHMRAESALINNFVVSRFVEPVWFLVIPGEVACVGVALCEGWEEPPDICLRRLL